MHGWPPDIMHSGRSNDRRWVNHQTALLAVARASTFLLLGCMYCIWFRYRTLLPSKPEPMHRGAFCQFPFQWIYYYHRSKSTENKTGKTHLCAMVKNWIVDQSTAGNFTVFNLLTSEALVNCLSRVKRPTFWIPVLSNVFAKKTRHWVRQVPGQALTVKVSCI